MTIWNAELMLKHILKHVQTVSCIHHWFFSFTAFILGLELYFKE